MKPSHRRATPAKPHLLHSLPCRLRETLAPQSYTRETREFHVVVSEAFVEIRYQGEHKITEIVNVKDEAEEPETTVIRGTKSWKNDDVADRPESITVVLYADGEEIARLDVSADEHWNYDFGLRAVYNADGEKVIYKVGEIVPKGYEVSFDGLNLINTKVEDDDAEEPVDPEKPVTEKPKTEAPKKDAQKTEPKKDAAPKTGDAGVLLPLLLAGFGVAGVGLLERKRRK